MSRVHREACSLPTLASSFNPTSLRPIAQAHNSNTRSRSIISLATTPISLRNIMASLDALPLEIQFEIFSYLVQPLSSYAYISPIPVTYEEQRRVEKLRHDRFQLMQHPYNQLAATCQQLRSSVEAACLHFLKGHHNHFKVPKAPKNDWNTAIAQGTVKRVVSKLPLAYRNRYLRSVFNKCIFCGKHCKRKAAFNRLMWCDQKCDIKHFGRLIVSSIYFLFNIHCL